MLCGWHTLSDIPLTGVSKSLHGSERIDIHIQLGIGDSPVAKNGEKVFFEHSAKYSRISIQGIADFEVSMGRRIRVWPAAGALQKDIEIILSGPAWATLCHQRGLLPLHASAVITERGIAAFVGHPGVGKSTIAALLSSLDYELVSDDILPISFDRRSQPGAWPYLRRLKLRNDSIVELALTPTEPVSETWDKEKFFVRPKFAGDDKWSRLERLYLLEVNKTNSRVSIDRITGAEAVRALIEQTYHFAFIRKSGQFNVHLANCTQLASNVAIYRVCRTPSFGAAESLGSAIRAHIKNTPT
jgi:hypothetical protein